MRVVRPASPEPSRVLALDEAPRSVLPVIPPRGADRSRFGGRRRDRTTRRASLAIRDGAAWEASLELAEGEHAPRLYLQIANRGHGDGIYDTLAVAFDDRASPLPSSDDRWVAAGGCAVSAPDGRAAPPARGAAALFLTVGVGVSRRRRRSPPPAAPRR